MAKQHIGLKIPIICVMIFSCLLNVLMFNCRDKIKIEPKLIYPGYNTKLLFYDDFNGDLQNWHIEGNGQVTITPEGKLLIEEESGSEGVAIWIRDDFSDNILIEYEVHLPQTPGINIAYICARGAKGEDIIKKLPARDGSHNRYTRSGINNYSISYHSYTPEGEHIPGSKIRKNPGQLLLSRVDTDPCLVNRLYLVHIIKISNRILFFVDGELIHDVRDKGGFGPTYREGKVGLWSHGSAGRFSMLLDNFRVFSLSPK